MTHWRVLLRLKSHNNWEFTNFGVFKNFNEVNDFLTNLKEYNCIDSDEIEEIRIIPATPPTYID